MLSRSVRANVGMSRTIHLTEFYGFESSVFNTGSIIMHISF